MQKVSFVFNVTETGFSMTVDTDLPGDLTAETASREQMNAVTLANVITSALGDLFGGPIAEICKAANEEGEDGLEETVQRLAASGQVVPRKPA